MNHTIGRAGFGLSSIISTWSSETAKYDPELRVEFIISAPSAHEYFEVLENQKITIEAELGQALVWSNPPNQRSCKIYARQSSNFLDRSLWPQQQHWLRENLEKFHRVFAPRVKQLDLSKSARPDIASNGDNEKTV